MSNSATFNSISSVSKGIKSCGRRGESHVPLLLTPILSLSLFSQHTVLIDPIFSCNSETAIKQYYLSFPVAEQPKSGLGRRLLVVS
jgi:hypothetical protein